MCCTLLVVLNEFVGQEECGQVNVGAMAGCDVDKARSACGCADVHVIVVGGGKGRDA